jgi:hypothetical protein
MPGRAIFYLLFDCTPYCNPYRIPNCTPYHIPYHCIPYCIPYNHCIPYNIPRFTPYCVPYCVPYHYIVHPSPYWRRQYLPVCRVCGFRECYRVPDRRPRSIAVFLVNRCGM